MSAADGVTPAGDANLSALDNEATAGIGKSKEPEPKLPRNFWLLWWAAAGSNLADGIFKLIVPLVAITLTRDPILVSGITVVSSLPWLVFALPVGAWVDRLDRRTVMLVANTIRCALLAVVSITFAVGVSSIWVLYALGLAVGIAEVFYDTSSQSILPQVVGKRALAKANGFLYGAEMTANTFIGPPVGGLLMGVSVALAFATPAALWGLAVGALFCIRGGYRAERSGEPKNLFKEIGEGLGYLFHHSVLRTLALMTGVANLASSGSSTMIVLFAVGEESEMGLNDTQFGMLFAVSAVGSLIGAVAAQKVAKLVGRTIALCGLPALVGLYLMTPYFTANVYVFAAMGIVSGFAISVWNVIVVSLRQGIVPEALLGRLNSSYRLLSWGTIPLGSALGGVIARWLGLRPVFLIFGLVVVALVALTPQISERHIAAAEAAAD
jgi:MFS family permease